MTTSGRAYERQDTKNRMAMRAWYEARHAENLAADPPRPDLVIFTEHILVDFNEIDAAGGKHGRRSE